MGHIIITFCVSCQVANLLGIMQFGAQTRSYLLCLWRAITVAVEFVYATIYIGVEETWVGSASW